MIEDRSYHDDPCPTPSLSASVAKILLSRSPRHAWMAHPRLNPEYVPVVSDVFDRGQAAHALLLEGEDRIEVIDYPDWRTNAAKDARYAARQLGKLPMLTHQAADVHRMAQVAREAWSLCPDLAGYAQSTGEAEKAIYWQDRATGIWCRSKLDWLSADRRLIVDYKTTDGSASPDDLARKIISLGYDVQVGAYLDAVASINPGHESKFVFLFQEVEAPFLCSWVSLDPAWLELGIEKWKSAKKLWAECLRSNVWPAYPDRICYLEPPAWAVADHQSREYSREDAFKPSAPDAKWLGA